MEPFKIKMIEHIQITTKKERIKTLQNCKYNLFNIPSNLVMIDLLTDSGTGAMSDEQWSAIMTGDESYANSKSFENLKKIIHELFNYKFFLPVQYVNLCIIFYFLKPSIFFYNDKPKKFGIINNDQTLFPFYLVALMISVMIYFIFTLYKYNSD